MEDFNTEENPINSIEAIISNLIDFSNYNKFDFTLYKSFADESSKSFNRYFLKIEDPTIKEKIISDLKTDFLFSIDSIVSDSLAHSTKIENPESGVNYYIGKPTPDDRVRDFENNYRKIKDLFLNGIEFEIKTSTAAALENMLKWNGTQTEFIELVKSLIENGNIKGTQTEIITKLSNVFNIEIKHPSKLITDIKTRNNGSETLFLDKLQKSLFDYITLEKRK